MAQLLQPKRIFLINRDFQFRYAGAGVVAGLVSTLVTAVLIIYPLFAFKILTIGFFLPWPIFLTITAAILINSMIQVLFGILLTHRIAGPIFNLIRHFRMIGRGKWNLQMRKRKLDELGIVVRHFNEMSAEITKTVLADIESIEKIKELLAVIDSKQEELTTANISLNEMSSRFKLRIASQGETL